MNVGLRLLPKPKVRKIKHDPIDVDRVCSFFVPQVFHTHPVEALNFLLLVLPLFAQGQQLILQVANLLLELRGLRVETLFLTLKHTENTCLKTFSFSVSWYC